MTVCGLSIEGYSSSGIVLGSLLIDIEILATPDH